MYEEESAEDEERSAPPQDLLALSVQHEAQEGLRDETAVRPEAQDPRAPSVGRRKGPEPQVLGLKPSCHLSKSLYSFWSPLQKWGGYWAPAKCRRETSGDQELGQHALPQVSKPGAGLPRPPCP